MAVSITSISLSEVPLDGGYLLELTGTFELATLHEVHVGPAGDVTDPICYSGKPGQANQAFPLSTTKLRVYTPELALGDDQDVFIKQVSSALTDSLADVLNVVKQDHQTRVFDLRRILPPNYRLGPRNMEVLGPV